MRVEDNPEIDAPSVAGKSYSVIAENKIIASIKTPSKEGKRALITDVIELDLPEKL